MRQLAFDPLPGGPVFGDPVFGDPVFGDPVPGHRSTAPAVDWPDGCAGDAEQDDGRLRPARGLVLGVMLGAAVWLGCGALVLWITCL